MAQRENLDEAIELLGDTTSEEVAARYRQTNFRSPSDLERSIEPFVNSRGTGFTINEYAQFLDEGTRFITAQEFITPVLEDRDGSIEEALTNAFEQDIDEALSNAFQGNV